MEVPEFLWHCSLDSEIIKFLFWKFHWVCWGDVEGMPQIIKKMTDIWKIVLGSRQCLNCVDGGSWVSLKLLAWLRTYRLWYFRSFTELVAMSEKRPELWAKWGTFGDLFFRQSLATLCDTLIIFREKHWLLRLIWRFSESLSEYESVFQICVWIIIHLFNIHSIYSLFIIFCLYWKYFEKVFTITCICFSYEVPLMCR